MALDFNLLNTNIPAEAASSAMKGMQQVNALTTQRLANEASDTALKNALAEQEVYKSSGSLEEAQQNLLRGGFGKSAAALGQSLATTKKTGLESTEKSMNIMRERTKDILGNTSNENYIAHMQEGVRDGLVTPDQAQRAIQIFTSIPPNQRAAYIQQQLAKAEKIYETNTISASQGAQLALTRRGQDLTDARARENLAKPVFNAEAGGWVVPPRIGKDGVASVAGTVIPVAGMTTKTTEGEKQSAFNAKRLLSAATTITKQVEKDASSTAPGTWEAMQPTEGMANLSRSPERQIVASNYADLIDAALYLATGAAYNKEQLEAQRQAYLPVWSDSPENRVQKQQKTVDLINAAKIRAGKNWTPDLDVAVSKLFPTAMEQSEAAPTTSKGNKPSLNDIFNPKK